MSEGDVLSQSPSHAEKLRGLRWAVASETFGSAYGVLVLGSILVLFLDELGLRKEQIGLLNGLIFLPGPIALFIAPYLARFGSKRSLIIFYGARKIVAALLILTPGVFAAWGASVVFAYVFAVMMLYGLCRVIAETAFYPWIQEFVPDRVRGQYMAVCNIAGTLAGILAVAWSSYMLGSGMGIGRFQVVIAVGCALGLVGIVLKFPIPGGAPLAKRTDQRTHFSQMRQAVRDRGFRRFLFGLGVLALATGGWAAFVPLYLKEAIGLDAGAVVGLHNWTLIGMLVSSYAWGYSADRKGSKPVLMAALLLVVLLPLGWMALPRHAADSALYAGVMALLSGVGMMGYSISNERLLFVSAVPPEKKTEYMAVFYTFTQILMALSPFLAGRVLAAATGWGGRAYGFKFDQYTPFFVGSLFLVLVGIWIFSGVSERDRLPGDTP
ncbi:MAG: MFS transporter [Gemmatimonadetes bacterium]|jgi:MFS family permease|nr:MFS transporter [Gemmatimonadota bacterium]MBT5328837.1 MFS transporter [Gemmatimonadota bacterium]MBT5447636.1 MFS transporter [Gemmatimonadota bacterium]MBT5801139.1 MFS transporter [Gemmatimonadota bacterium]MBT6618483.1 MFS transporter [Gemmatimonadota bacterium]